VQVASAPSLSLLLTATPTSAHIGDEITYTVTVTNNGTGDAGGVEVLVALPPGFGFTSTQGTSGNSNRDTGNDPYRNAEEVYYDGFTIPAKGGGGPGLLTITFQAQIFRGVADGNYPASVQVTDNSGDEQRLSNAVPVSVSNS
jgi:uncharacterized repeat protein (TIGR01451 family)